MSRPPTLPGRESNPRSSNVDDGQPNYSKQFQEVVKRWDEAKNDPAHYDPTDTLCEMANILEKVTFSRFS